MIVTLTSRSLCVNEFRCVDVRMQRQPVSHLFIHYGLCLHPVGFGTEKGEDKKMEGGMLESARKGWDGDG